MSKKQYKQYMKEAIMVDMIISEELDKDRNDCSMKLYMQFYNELSNHEKHIVDKYLYDVQNPKWRPVYEDGKLTNYEVSNLSEVRNVQTGRTLTPIVDRKGYIIVSLSINGHHKNRRVHRLSSIAFIPNPKNKPQVNHINGIKDFNWIGNLEWNTAEENVRHAWLTGLQTYRYGEECNSSIYKEHEIHNVCKMLEENRYLNTEIAEVTGVDVYTVSKIKCREDWLTISSRYNIPIPIANAEGEAAAASKYTEYQIREVCKMLERTQISARKISAQTGVSMDMIWRVKVGLNWTNVSKDYNIEANSTIRGIDKRIHSEDEIHAVCKRMQNGERIVDISNNAGIPAYILSSIKNGRDWKSISCNYTFNIQKPGRPHSISTKRIHEICRLLSEGKLGNKEISDKLGVLPGLVSSIKQRTSYPEISELYDFKTATMVGKNSSFTEDQVHDICKRLEKGEVGLDIAKSFGVNPGVIYQLKNSSVWAHIISKYNIKSDSPDGSVNSRETVVKVCELLSENKYKNTEIANMLGVKATFVSDIKQRKQWKDVSCNYTWILQSKPRSCKSC